MWLERHTFLFVRYNIYLLHTTSGKKENKKKNVEKCYAKREENEQKKLPIGIK